MEQHKATLLEAYSQLYELEITLRNHLLSLLPDLLTSNQPSYWQLITLTLDYNSLQLSPKEKKVIRHTTSIRNKVCHMQPLTSQDVAILRKALTTLTDSNSSNSNRIIQDRVTIYS